MFSFRGSNFKNFLLGSARDRELDTTRAAWEDTQASWQASRLSSVSTFDLCMPILQMAVDKAGRAPCDAVVNAAGFAIEQLLIAEAIGVVEPNWDLIETDVGIAVDFRKMLTRRKRWAADFKHIYGTFGPIVAERIAEFFNALPECCYDEIPEKDGDTFDVPLIDLLDNPVSVIDRLFMLPYQDESFRLDLFYCLRDQCEGNSLVASGFQRNDNIHELSRKLVPPDQQRNKTGAEIAELYLSGSPLKELLDVVVPFRIPDALRFEHCHIVGGTGHGKTQLMQKMIHADLIASQKDSRSVVVIDSQGDLINKLVRLELFSPDVPDSLADRLVLIDPADVEYPAALNLFDAHLDRVRSYSAADRERVLNGVIELYELFFGAFLGAELTQKQGVVFKYLARLMLAIPNATIHTLMQIMEDGKRFKPYMDKLDGSAKYFFESEFFHPSFAPTKKQVLRRLWGVLSTPAFERMFTQPKNKLDLFEAMNEGKIILVSTAKDLLKREGSQLLGRFFIAMLTQAALERSTLPQRSRNPTLVYVDEAQEYFDDSIETILNQARKYAVGLTLAHQSLDQLSPRLRSAILANTSMKCVGGVSAKDARALNEELHTTHEFILGMKRRGARSEFAVWVKNLCGSAIRLSVPLGYLERQPTLDDEDYDALLAANRTRYCGTLADIPPIVVASSGDSALEEPVAAPKPKPSKPTPQQEPLQKPPVQRVCEPLPMPPAEPMREEAPAPEEPIVEAVPVQTPPPEPEPRVITEPQHTTPPKAAPRTAPQTDRQLGKGGKKHRYLQSLVKELAEQQGLKATIEAPLTHSAGQVDVSLERDGLVAAIEISVTTPVEHERENLRKCLAEPYPRIAIVLAKSKKVQTSYRNALFEIIPEADRERVTFLTPEEIPDYIGSLAAPPEPEERVVRGYRVKGSFVATTPDEARARQDAIARLLAQSLGRNGS